jgi:ribosome-associated toxin RatA of RatAB toxin-antitoxin module
VKTIALEVRCPQVNAEDMYRTLADYARYPQLVEIVRGVEVSRTGPNSGTSRWEVAFQTGVLEWSELDEFNASERTIRFTANGGDPEHYAGLWRVREAGDGSVVSFSAEFDLGMPTFSAVIEPVAERTLRENVLAIVRGIAGAHLGSKAGV